MYEKTLSAGGVSALCLVEVCRRGNLTGAERLAKSKSLSRIYRKIMKKRGGGQRRGSMMVRAFLICGVNVVREWMAFVLAGNAR